MGINPSSSTPAASAVTVKARLEQVQKELAALRRRTQWATRMTVIIGILMLGILGAYFAIGYQQINSVLRPDLLLNYVEQEVTANLPSMRQAVEKEINNNAPVWAASLSQQALDGMPSARQKLEDYSMEQYEATIREVVQLTEQEFRDYLRANRKMLEKKFDELGTNELLAEDSLKELQHSLEGKLQVNFQAQAREVLDTIRSANAKLKRLRDGKNLTKEEHNERRVAMLMRRLQLDFDPSKPVVASAPSKPETRPDSADSGKRPTIQKLHAPTKPLDALIQKDAPTKTKDGKEKGK